MTFDPDPRPTRALRAVVRALLDDPDHQRSRTVDQLAADTGLDLTTAGLAVWRLLDAGWLDSPAWHAPNDRHCYRLTPDARTAATHLLTNQEAS